MYCEPDLSYDKVDLSEVLFAYLDCGSTGSTTWTTLMSSPQVFPTVLTESLGMRSSLESDATTLQLFVCGARGVAMVVEGLSVMVLDMEGDGVGNENDDDNDED
jgi:hypothetical protein